MNQLHLSLEESEVLQDVLRHAIAEIEREILHTDSRDFKERLKHRRDVLDLIAGKLEPNPVFV